MGLCAETYRGRLLPQWFVLPPFGESHCGWIHNGMFLEQRLDVVSECISGIYSTQPISNVAKMWIQFVWRNQTIVNPCIWHTFREAWINNNVGIPKTGMVGTDVANHRHATKPSTHLFKLGNIKTTTDCFLCSTIVHIGIKFRECTQRSNFQSLPYWRHGRTIILSEVFQVVFVLRTIEFFLQAIKIVLKLINVYTKNVPLWYAAFLADEKR